MKFLTDSLYSSTKLVTTTHLNQLQLVYNTEGLLICKICDMGVKIDQIRAHVTKNEIKHPHAKCDNHYRSCPKGISNTVVAELEELLDVKPLPTIEMPQGKRSAIEGLKCHEGFYICDRDGCFLGYSTKSSLLAHHAKSHKKKTKKKQGNYREGWCQSLYINPAIFFEVDPPASASTSGSTFVLSTFLENRKKEIFYDQQPKHLPTDSRLIPPVFVELGFSTFIQSLDQNSISDYMNRKNRRVFSRLRLLAVQCFQDDCKKLNKAHKSIREGIMEAPS